MSHPSLQDQTKIAIIDYDVGNIEAVRNMFRRLGFNSHITSDPAEVASASHIVLPGNGSFDSCVTGLVNSRLLAALENKVIRQRTPLLGICVGAQILGSSSSEGKKTGLSWIDMDVHRLPALPDFRIPHMGWNSVTTTQANHPLTSNIEPDSRFYFIHSYYMCPRESSNILLSSTYGVPFASAVASSNIVGVQFHPEKSHRFGLKLLNAFASWHP